MVTLCHIEVCQNSKFALSVSKFKIAFVRGFTVLSDTHNITWFIRYQNSTYSRPFVSKYIVGHL